MDALLRLRKISAEVGLSTDAGLFGGFGGEVAKGGRVEPLDGKSCLRRQAALDS